MKNLKMKVKTFEMLPKSLDLTITWGTSRAKDTYGYNLVTIKELLNSKKYRTCGGGYDMLATALGYFIQDNFQLALQEVVGQMKEFYGLSQRKDGFIYVEGGCGISEMVKILTNLLGYDVTYEYKRDRKGRPQHKTAILLRKKQLPVNVRLYTEAQIIEKPVFNVRGTPKYVSEFHFNGLPTVEDYGYYLKRNPTAKFVAVRGHSNMWYLHRVPRSEVNLVLKKAAEAEKAKQAEV